jgi:hypothetical protein
MVSLRALRNNPHFAPLFAHVLPFFWPVLWWSLNRLLRWYASAGLEDVLFATTRWGWVEIVCLGDRKPDPAAYRPYTPERPRWDDPVRASDLPAELRVAPALSRLSAMAVWSMTGAAPVFALNSS